MLQMLPKEEMGSTEAANKWIQANYVPYYEEVFIEYISVGNEAIPGPYAKYVFPAMQNLDASFRAAGLYESVHISTTVSSQVLANSYPPSNAIFAYNSAYYMNEITKFLGTNEFPLMINVYPYFALDADPKNVGLKYAIFESETPVFYDQGLPYYNLYAAMIDAFVAAMWKPTEGRPVDIVVAETGWPSADARRRDSKIIGINYGLLGDNLPPPKEAIKLVMEKGIQGVRIDEPNHEVLEALRGTGLIISVGVKNVDLAEIAGSKEAANKWIQTNYVPYYEDVFIEYISVGNEAIPGPNAEYVFPAMQNLDASFRAAGLYESVHISTTVSTKVLSNSHTPSKAIFAYDSAYYMNEIAKFLDSNSFPLMINVYPFFAMYADPSYNTLNYAIFGSETPVFL
ncbi:hypothetical protein IFM89_037566 [Coptis chinensis]|uniref:Glucan endo-1,3-beta-D-glucosidase n=1 Tax=Coptis chinensis TaxID=261450 RepID=A0A835I099_9MAGN|nr:hypothetical protein IFM89_037566 [Coptis chinensis]